MTSFKLQIIEYAEIVSCNIFFNKTFKSQKLTEANEKCHRFSPFSKKKFSNTRKTRIYGKLLGKYLVLWLLWLYVNGLNFHNLSHDLGYKTSLPTYYFTIIYLSGGCNFMCTLWTSDCCTLTGSVRGRGGDLSPQELALRLGQQRDRG